MKTTILAFTLLTLSTLAACVQADPIITELTSRSAFNAVVTGQTTETFESFGVPSNVYFQEPTPLSTSIGTFSNGNTYFIGNGSSGVGAGDGSSFLTSNGFYSSTLTLNSGYTAAGSDVFDAYGSSTSLHPEVAYVTESNGTSSFTQQFSFNIAGATGSPSTKFVGFVATAGYTLTSITYYADTTNHNYGDGEYHAFDNFSVGTYTVPEPSTYATLALGLGALAFGLRRRFKI